MRKLRFMWLAVLAWLLLGGLATNVSVVAQDAPNAGDVTADQVNDVAHTAAQRAVEGAPGCLRTQSL